MTNKIFLELLDMFGSLFIDHKKETENTLIYFISDSEAYKGEATIYIDKNNGDIQRIVGRWEGEEE